MLNLIHRQVWQRLPYGLRRAAFFHGSCFFAPRPRPDAVPAEPVIVAGAFRTSSGLGRITFYPEEVALVPDFFSADAYREAGGKPACIVTSIAMFYDLEDPIDFARQVESILAPGDIWHFEQSYMPSMLRLVSYDTVCHEHLEYYSLGVVQKILDAAGMRVLDVKMNSVNGGSFAVTAVRRNDPRSGGEAVCAWLLEQEDRMGLHTPRPYRDFEERVFRHRADLRRLLETLKADGKKVLGYGASTKGNVVLQFCGIGPGLLPCIAEVNEGSSAPSHPAPVSPSCPRRRPARWSRTIFWSCPGTFARASSGAKQSSSRGAGASSSLSLRSRSSSNLQSEAGVSSGFRSAFGSRTAYGNWPRGHHGEGFPDRYGRLVYSAAWNCLPPIRGI